MNRVATFLKKLLKTIQDGQEASARSRIAFYIRDVDYRNFPELRTFKGDRVDLDQLLKKKGLGGI